MKILFISLNALFMARTMQKALVKKKKKPKMQNTSAQSKHILNFFNFAHHLKVGENWHLTSTSRLYSILSFRDSIYPSKLPLRLDFYVLSWLFFIWHLVGTQVLEARVLSRPLESRFLCSKNYIVYSLGIYLN